MHAVSCLADQYGSRQELKVLKVFQNMGCCGVQVAAGDVIIDLGKAGVEAKEHGRQRQQLDWREASPSQPLDARPGQPVLLQACSLTASFV